MRIKTLTVAGFRGFNKVAHIDFDSRLTLVAAPNSHGKTSITEALEFLIFGQTTKVAYADSKDEYRNSYRNAHYPADQPAHIEAVFTDDEGASHTVRVELDSDEKTRRYFDNKLVDVWPFSEELRDAAPPFVLQHALKNLLLVPPTERFQGFAQLLGLFEVDMVQRALVSLCTKPEATISHEAKQFLVDLRSLEERVGAIVDLKPIGTLLAKDFSNFEKLYLKIHERAEKVLGKKFQASMAREALETARADAAAKVYDGSVAIRATSSFDKTKLDASADKIRAVIDRAVYDGYVSLGSQDALERLQAEASFLKFGLDSTKKDSLKCPFCKQQVSDTLLAHVAERHEGLEKKLKDVAPALSRSDVRLKCEEAYTAAEQHLKILMTRGKPLLDANLVKNQTRVKALFGSAGEANWKIVEAAGLAVRGVFDSAEQELSLLKVASEKCTTAIDAKHEEISEAEALAKAASNYLREAESCAKKLDELQEALSVPEKALRHSIDALAGTTELAILNELLGKKDTLKKTVKIRDVVVGLKSLKKHVEQAIGEIMEAAIGTDLTGTVMSWYEKIRTTGDPDVHFSGFAMERTKAGDFKKKRVKVSAKSYGKELASAVSSLSESKLNALGLCVSIATTLRAAGPWDFLILDDPIQSWDEDHEVQFITVLRTLVEDEGQQVVLLSHRRTWTDQVALNCRSLNGIRYEFTGYTLDGPEILQREWASVDDRLQTAFAIANNPQSSTVQLQQAEEEIRIAVCQIVSDIAKQKLKRERSPHSLNSKACRAILVQTACPDTLTDRVIATFGTTDDAHHAPKKYEPNPERIRQYHGALQELKKWAA